MIKYINGAGGMDRPLLQKIPNNAYASLQEEKYDITLLKCGPGIVSFFKKKSMEKAGMQSGF